MVKSGVNMTTVGCNPKVLSPAQIIPGDKDFEVPELPRIHWPPPKGNSCYFKYFIYFYINFKGFRGMSKIKFAVGKISMFKCVSKNYNNHNLL